MAEVNGNIAVPGGQIGSGEAQVFNPAPTLQLLAQMQERADNQAKLDALAKMKQQEAEAKAAKEAQVKFPELDVAKEGIWGQPANEAISGIHQEAISKIGATNDPTQRALLTNDARNRIAAVNNANTRATKEYVETEKKLKDLGYNVPNTLAATKYGTKDWFNKDIITDLEKTVTSNPEYYNYALLGELAAKNIATKTVKVKKADGKEHDEIVPVIANYNDKENRLEIKASEAIPYLEQIPSIKQQLPFVIKSILEKNKVDPSIIDKPYEQLTPAEKGSIISAQPEVISRYLGGRLGVTVVDDFTTEEGKAKQKKLGETAGDIVSGNAAITRDIRYKEPNTGEIRRIKGFVGDVEQKEIRKGQPVELSANKTVFILGGGGAQTKELIKKAFMENTDGSWTTKFGGSVRNWAKFKEPVYRLVKPTTVTVKEKGQNVDVVRPAGTVLTKAEGLRTKARYPNNVQESEAYILSPTKLQSVSSDDPDVADVFKNPAFKDVEIIIPITEANEFAPYHKTKLPSW